MSQCHSDLSEGTILFLTAQGLLAIFSAFLPRYSSFFDVSSPSTHDLPTEDMNIVEHFGKPSVASYSIASNECCLCSYNFCSNDAEAQLSVLYLYFRVPLTAFLMASAGSTNCWRKCFFILMVFPISMDSFLLYFLLSVCLSTPPPLSVCFQR